MGFFVRVDASGDVLEAHGTIVRDAGRLYGLSGVGPGGLEGLIEAYSENHASFSSAWVGQYSAVVVAENTVVLAQSSLGLGRAYYGQTDHDLVVGSDLNDVARGLGCTDPDSVYFSRFLAMRPVADRTPYAAVRRLCHGETVVFKHRSKRAWRPWMPTHQDLTGCPTDRLHGLLDEAIDLYAPAGDPIMIDISGGTDSSLVAAVAADMGRDLHAISFIPEKGVTGQDRHFAKLVADRLSIPLAEVDTYATGRTTALPDLPDHPGNCSYREIMLRIGEHFRSCNASRHLTGVGGDVVFDFRGLAPAFLADPLVQGRLLAAWKTASAYAAERGGHRSAAHFLRYVATPIAVSYLRGRNTGALPQDPPPDFLSPAVLETGVCQRSALASRVRRPSSRFLWELVFEMTAAENLSEPLSPTTHTVHPLLHRPLVEHCLSLTPEVRRGIGGDRALQRWLLRKLGLAEIAERTDKGSNQPLREMDLVAEPTFLESLIDGEVASRGWVDPSAWNRAVDQARVGVSPNSAFFAAAVECELWLRRAVADGQIKPAADR